MRRKILIIILVSMLMFPTLLGAVSSSNIEAIKPLSKVTLNNVYTHTILGESFTSTICQYCKYQHKALKNLYHGGWHPFYYLSLVFDVNKHSEQRMNELNVLNTPAVVWDGGYRMDVGATGVQEAMARYNTSLIICGNRNVANIDLDLDVTYLGAVDPSPADGATNVVVETNLTWWVTAMDIDYTIENNGASQYNGHLHIYVTEVNSSYWKDKFGDPYTFAFLDYAFNGDVSVSAGGTLSNSVTWDGKYHDNGYGEYFDEIKEDNAMVIASVFNDNTNYTDETAGLRAGIGTDPKAYDIYFGTTNPPPKVISNTSARSYNPEGNLEFNTAYYWKIDVWDNQGNPKYGTVWDFTTRPNNPPSTPYNPVPANNSLGVPINTNISWYGGDPDFDSVTYDVYLGLNPSNLPLVSSNQTETIYDPSPLENLEFNKKYYWKIVAWDEYGLKASTAPLWNFMTQANLPPAKASNPFPKDEANNIPTTDVVLSWNGSDPNPGDTLKYDVYFGTSSPPTLVSSGQSATTYDISYELDLFKKYYWRIDTLDRDGLKTVGDEWKFTTGINDPPNPPVITGPTRVKAGGTYEYTFSATDDNEDDVSFWIAWGDQTSTGWTEFVQSGEEVTINHTWPEEPKEKTYIIKAKAKDNFGAEGEWGQLIVKTPLNMQNSQSFAGLQHFLIQFSQRSLGSFTYLSNIQLYAKTMNLQ